ncbi:EMAP domain protein [Nitzschia inconspicua]|uniref:EMAP domain protein n=1 Tax=Nitzschia inconspicua TaxID=303405 RepID=A0A9K3KVF3_9STRA|nr:EMAP domain protein [Nitzschia inconspicua]
MTSSKTAMELLETAICDLECRLGGMATGKGATQQKKENKTAKDGKQCAKPPQSTAEASDLPEILKLEFKVGRIAKVWNHPEADKLYCEEIDVGEEQPRQIASGLRPHFSLEEMQGQRLLVVANLKAKNLVRFKSHGMVLCAADEDGKVEFVEPPEDAPIGEVVTFEGLPPPQPLAPAQVEKKKVFANCMEGMKTTNDTEPPVAVWNGHAFMTSAGPCTVRTIKGGVLR